MQEHPIPQDITGYRFHIIGSMTLKQFGEVLLGVIVAVILFNTNLIAVVKWLLIVLSVGLGAAAAFVPIEERPLDHWIITFFSVLYKPTKFYWRRIPQIPDLFMYENTNKTDVVEDTLDLSPAKRERIKEYVSSIPEVKQDNTGYTPSEIARMQGILDSFTTVQVSNMASVPTSVKKIKPRVDVRVRKMRLPAIQETVIFEDTMPMQIPNATIYEDSPKKELKPTLELTKKSILASDQVANDIQIPKEEAIKTISQKEHQDQISNRLSPANDSSVKSYLEPVAQNTKQTIASTEASFNTDLPFPIKPTEPNKVVGMILSQSNELLTNAIVEIQTLEGNIARAVKTNALGQFFVTTPLKVGEYNLIVEKSGYQFQPQHIKVEDKIIQPMEIRSNN
jgi:hypothetical protein